MNDISTMLWKLNFEDQLRKVKKASIARKILLGVNRVLERLAYNENRNY